MLTLHGSPNSNYYNKVKLALLEKEVPFTEAYAATHSTADAILGASPLGKIPFVTTAQGGLCESQPLMEWIEAAWPHPPLLPADPFAAAKVRELTTFLDWHLEIVARELYGPAFLGAAALSQGNADRIRKHLIDNIAAFKRLAKFAPFVAGEAFTQADCAAFAHLPLVAMASKAVFGEDLLQAAGIDHRGYVKLIAERPAAQKVVADRKAAQAAYRATGKG
ncbi:MAG: glutathione S-transferase family protein [Ramlibacter sp.]|nr:glutathione S-transferase family protein [Ramlibacter sp.]